MTVSLFKVKDGPCIGGYTAAQWESGYGKYVKDPQAFIFNLTHKRHFPCKDPNRAIFCANSDGPNFGGMDLAAREDNFIRENNCVSVQGRIVYNVPFDSQYRNMLINQVGKGQFEDSFTITELEVWQIDFK